MLRSATSKTLRLSAIVSGGTERFFPARQHDLKTVFRALIDLARLSNGAPFSNGVYRAWHLAIAECLAGSDAEMCIASMLDGFFGSGLAQHVYLLGDNFGVARVSSACGTFFPASGFGDSLATGTAPVMNLRLAKLAQGGTRSRTEAQLMVTEKGFALAEALVTLSTGGSMHKVLRRYRGHVRTNKRRLSRTERMF
jgi:hypothetical protein